MTNSKQNHKPFSFTEKDATIHKIITKFKGFFRLDEYQVSHKLFNGGQSDVLSREIFDRGDTEVLMPYYPIKDTVLLNIVASMPLREMLPLILACVLCNKF
jgi:ADP-ribose pyrophosphatase